MKKLEKFKFQEINAQSVRGGINKDGGIDYSYSYSTTYINGEAYSDKTVDDICYYW